MYLKINGREFCCTGSETWLELIRQMPEVEPEALGVMVNGRILSLGAPVEEYARATVLTYAHEEGRRIYERSLRLLFLSAAHRLYPDVSVRIEHSYGMMLYISLIGEVDPAEFTESVEAQMHVSVQRDARIHERRVTAGNADGFFTLHALDGYEDCFYGTVVPSAGRIDAFALKLQGQGVVLMQPLKEAPHEKPEILSLPMLQAVYEEHERWCRILNCNNATDLNAMVDRHGLREFIRVSEALLEKNYQHTADQFVRSGARLMLIAGPSSSGKTTTSHRLMIALKVNGLRPVKLSLDDYYLNRESIPFGADGSRDFERPDALDLALLSEQLPGLLAGETVELPRYDFKTGMRSDVSVPMRVEPDQPIIIEGIHALNDCIAPTVPREMKFKLYISALTVLNLDEHNHIRSTDARLLRRIVRDHQFRATPPEETMQMWESVRNGEENYIYPYREQADAMLNTALPYELVVMKKYAYPLLMTVQPESPYYTLARRLLELLKFIETADVEDEIPVNSVLREFIGGCCFYRDGD